ncbi:MAG: response regulator [Eubacteriales bacterium]|nr:response regulator [Eubacteriales bacterium]
MICRIVVVEDEPAIQQGIVALIQRLDLPVQVIASYDTGEAALKNLFEDKPHIIITDIQMPAMTGLELISRIKQQGYEAEYLILSGYADFEYVRTALKLSVNNYLLKPPRMRELYDSLRYLCQKQEQAIYEKKRLLLLDLLHQRRSVRTEDLNPESLCASLILFGIGAGGRPKSAEELPNLNQWNCQSLLDFLREKHAFSENLWVIDEYDPTVKAIVMFTDSYEPVPSAFLQILQQFGAQFQLPMTFVVSSKIDDLSSLPDVNTRCLQYLLQSSASGKDQIIYEALKDSSNNLQLNDAIQALYTAVCERYWEDINFKDFAKKYGYHQGYLMAQFAKVYEIPPKKLLMQKRMEKAMELLAKSQLRIKDIAEMVGYTDVAYFNRVFKENTGTTPKLYRESHGVPSP